MNLNYPRIPVLLLSAGAIAAAAGYLSKPGPVRQEPRAVVRCVSGTATREDEVQLTRLFEQDAGEGAFQSVSCAEAQFASATASEIQTVQVKNRGGRVVLLNSEKPRVLVLVGKHSHAETYERAREYLKQFRYEKTREGSTLRIALEGPSEESSDASGDVVCYVMAPPTVRVVAVSGQ